METSNWLVEVIELPDVDAAVIAEADADADSEDSGVAAAFVRWPVPDKLLLLLLLLEDDAEAVPGRGAGLDLFFGGSLRFAATVEARTDVLAGCAGDCCRRAVRASRAATPVAFAADLADWP